MSTPKVIGSPDEIYLVYGDLDEDTTHAEEERHGEVYWCGDKQFPSDVRYVLAPPDDQMAVDARRPPVTLQIFSELVDNADARAKRVEAAAQALLDAVDANHEKPIPLKYTIPYGAVNDLRAAMKETP